MMIPFDTITLLNNTELAEPLSVPLNDHYISHFTLDLNGKTISAITEILIRSSSVQHLSFATAALKNWKDHKKR